MPRINLSTLGALAYYTAVFLLFYWPWNGLLLILGTRTASKLQERRRQRSGLPSPSHSGGARPGFPQSLTDPWI